MNHKNRWGEVSSQGSSELKFPYIALWSDGANLELFLDGQDETVFIDGMVQGGIFVLTSDDGRRRVIPSRNISCLYCGEDNRPNRYEEVRVRFIRSERQ